MSSAPSLLSQRMFLRMWAARVGSTMASQMLAVAVGWQMYELTGSAWDLGLVGLMEFLPTLVLLLPAGHVVDRFHRARVVAVCMAVMLALALWLAWAAWGGWATRTQLLAVALAIGCVRAFQMPANQALTPSLVPRELLARAMAFASMGLRLAAIVGPAVGGLVYAAGSHTVYGVSALLFATALTLALSVRYPHERPTEAVSLHSLLAGVRHVLGHRVVLGAISLDMCAVLLGGATALLPIFAKDVLQTGPWGLGLLRSAPAVGALLVSAWLTRHPIQHRCGAWLLGTVAAYGVAMSVFSQSSLLWLSLLCLTVSGGFDMVSVVIRHTLVQLETPDAMRGRVSAVNSLFIGASNELGDFRAGAVASGIGAPWAVLLGGLGSMAVALAWWRVFPALARRDALLPASPAAGESAP